MNLKQHEQFFEMYEVIDKKAERLFDDLEQLYRDYAKESSYYRERYEYDGFSIDCGYIELRGSYSYQSDWGHMSYDIPSEDFFESGRAIQKEARKIQEMKDSAARRAKERNELQMQKEYQEYLNLKQKFEEN